MHLTGHGVGVAGGRLCGIMITNGVDRAMKEEEHCFGDTQPF